MLVVDSSRRLVPTVDYTGQGVYIPRPHVCTHIWCAYFTDMHAKGFHELNDGLSSPFPFPVTAKHDVIIFTLITHKPSTVNWVPIIHDEQHNYFQIGHLCLGIGSGIRCAGTILFLLLLWVGRGQAGSSYQTTRRGRGLSTAHTLQVQEQGIRAGYYMRKCQHLQVKGSYVRRYLLHLI